VTVLLVSPQVAVPTVFTNAGIGVIVTVAWLLSGLLQLAPPPL
jgi:hypothetical protein